MDAKKIIETLKRSRPLIPLDLIQEELVRSEIELFLLRRLRRIFIAKLKEKRKLIAELQQKIDCAAEQPVTASHPESGS